MTILGRSTESSDLIALDAAARSRGTYVIGATGMGKTTLLQSVAYQDMAAGHGLCVLDPHGDMIDWLLERVPEEREKDVILFNPADEERPFGLNLLACDRKDPKQMRWVVSTIMATFRRLFDWTWGPRLEHVLAHTLWTAMTIKDSTLVDVLLLLTDTKTRKKHLKHLKEPLLKNFWDEFPKDDQKRMDFVSSTVNKLTPFLLDESMRLIVGQTKNTFDLPKIMNERKILLVNLSKGDLGENNSSLLGSVLVNLILMAALSRRSMDVRERQEKQFHLIVDEYQNFASDSFSVLQSEARKYGVDLVVAHQFRDQLTTEIRGSALNVGNFVGFRTTGVDGPELASQFDNTPPEPEIMYEPEMVRGQRDPNVFRQKQNTYVKKSSPRRLYSDMLMERANQLTNLPPYHFAVRMIEPAEPNSRRLQMAEYALTTIDPQGEDETLIKQVYGEINRERAARIRQRSSELARPRVQVKAEIDQRTFHRAGFDNTTQLSTVLDSELVADDLGGRLTSEF